MARRSRHAAKPTVREQEVAQALAEAEQRGDDYVAVGRRLGIRESTVRWWASQIRCRGMRREVGSPSRALAPSFVEVQVAPVCTAAAFEAVLQGGREVRVPNGFDAGELARLIVVLERAC